MTTQSSEGEYELQMKIINFCFKTPWDTIKTFKFVINILISMYMTYVKTIFTIIQGVSY